MAQSTRDFPGTIDRGAAARGRIIDVWAAQDTLNSGPTAPSNPVAYMLWADTTALVLKQRNGANNAWVSLAPLAAGLLPLSGGTLTAALTLHADPTSALHAATKQYVDANDAELRGGVSSVIATTSGTAHDVTGLPSWVNEIEVSFRNVSLNGAGSFLLQLGTSGGFVTSGYLSGGNTRFQNELGTSGFIFGSGISSSNLASGIVRVVRMGSGNVWAASYTMLINDGDGFGGYGGGSVDLGGQLTQVRFTRSGTASFDAGAFVVRWRR